MKLTEMTEEELIAARSVHEKTGASLKVAKIDELLNGPEEVSASDLVKKSVKKYAEKLGPEIVDKLTELHVDADPVAEAYKLKSDTTMSWKEIGDRVGLKAQGLYAKVKKYARENELPYE